MQRGEKRGCFGVVLLWAGGVEEHRARHGDWHLHRCGGPSAVKHMETILLAR